MAGSLELIRQQNMNTSTSDISITSLFSGTYSTYFISTSGVQSSGYSRFTMRLLDSSGNAITATEYDVAMLLLNSASGFTETRGVNDNRFFQFLGYNLTDGSAPSQGASGYIFNPYESSSYTSVQSQSSNNGGNLVGMKYIGVHKVAEQITGIQLKSEGFSGTTTFESGTTNIYGLAVT
jgi:hypothetical protein